MDGAGRVALERGLGAESFVCFVETAGTIELHC